MPRRWVLPLAAALCGLTANCGVPFACPLGEALGRRRPPVRPSSRGLVLHAAAETSIVASSPKVFGLGTIWAATGIGPVAAGIWATLSPVPPFSWLQWMFEQVAAAPAIYQYYIIYTLANMLAKWLIPGIHAQVMTGTWLGILKATNRGAYLNNVVLRLRGLLEKQARLAALPGRPVPAMPKETLDALSERLRDDAVLADAMGSTSALRFWHRFEKKPLDSPELLKRVPTDSQARWVLEALTRGYLTDARAVALQATLQATVSEAHRKLQDLSKAVDAAAFDKRNGVPESAGAAALLEVERTSAAAAEAVQAVDQLRRELKALKESEINQRPAWEAKMAELSKQHDAVPAVAAELLRLKGAGGLASAA